MPAQARAMGNCRPRISSRRSNGEQPRETEKGDTFFLNVNSQNMIQACAAILKQRCISDSRNLKSKILNCNNAKIAHLTLRKRPKSRKLGGVCGNYYGGAISWWK